ncbi:unnamed protein product [Pleuronectes platessa]|uniref:Uncharacterized protein n=1 Tax=Pleuronectes platessa TaxID=8262 RepID=A0A9N7W4E0_PLEPL|nr:unnamed protein product [Pleuronectes platessa]
MRALVTGSGGDYEYEIVRILPTHLARAVLLWDSLPAAVQANYSAVKEKRQEAFRKIHFLDRFRENLSARPDALVYQCASYSHLGVKPSRGHNFQPLLVTLVTFGLVTHEVTRPKAQCPLFSISFLQTSPREAGTSPYPSSSNL